MFGPIGTPELLLILAVVLVVFGAGKLPEVGSSIGKGIRNFKKAISEPEESKKPQQIPEKAPETEPKETPKA